MFGPTLDARQVAILRKHQYRSGGKSVLELAFFDWFWTVLVESVPVWLAPNVLTLLGIGLLALPCAAVLWFCPTGTENVSLETHTGLNVSDWRLPNTRM